MISSNPDKPSSDMSRDYHRAGFGARLGMGRRPCLLVIDVVAAYVDRDSPLYADVDEVVASVGRILDLSRRQGLPVFFTAVTYRRATDEGGVFRRKVPSLDLFEEGSALARLAAGLHPGPGELVIKKQYASAFFGTSLASELAVRSVDTCIIVGLTTSGCVRATAVDACQHGYVPIVVRQAVGDRAEGPHLANLFDLEAKYADVVSEAELESLLAGRVA